MRRQFIALGTLLLIPCTFGKRQRTPHFITGLGDGNVRREKGDKLLRHDQQGDAGGNNVHPGVPTDDIFQVTHHQRRKQNPNHYRLRPSESAINERLARMADMENGRENRWDTMFTSSSTDNSGISNPMRTGEQQWQMSAFAVVGMIVFLSALFLHLVSDSSSSAGGGSTSHPHHNPKYHSRVQRQRQSHGGTAIRKKKKTDEYSEDEEEFSDADYPHPEGQATIMNPSAAVNSPGAAGAASAKPVLFYPYQPRHRKPSASGYKEVLNGAAYSPGAASASGGLHSRNSYYLNPTDGPMLPSYSSPRPSPYQQKSSTPQQPQQQQQHPNSSNNKYTRTPRNSVTAADMASPGQPNRVLAPALENEFVATGLESFDDGTSTPLQQRQVLLPPVMTTPKRMHEDDEESQHALSDTHSSPSSSNSPSALKNRQPSSYTNVDEAYTAYGQMQMNLSALPMSGSGQHGNNLNGSNSMQNDNTQHHSNMQAQQNLHHGFSFSSSQDSSNAVSLHQPRLSVSSNHSGCLIPQGFDSMELEETPRAGLKRRTVDVLDKTPKAHGATAKQAYQAYNSVQRRQQQQGQHQRIHSSDANDPFQRLRLPSTSSMQMDAQQSPAQAQQARQHINLDLPLKTSSHHNLPYQQRPYDGQQQQRVAQSPFQQQQQQQQGGRAQQQAGVPFIPSLDMATAAAMAQQQQNSKNNAPRSIQIEELQLMKMESGSVPHWEVRHDGTVHLPPPQQQLPPPHQSCSSSSAFSVASDSNQDYEVEDDDNPNDPRKGIKHKRQNLTMATDATSSLQSSIEFSELKLVEVIGGGGFGQVWKANWHGTPVAVKVLTGSAQAKHVSKAILQEFAAEINLLKGMRHPNICLYMGASVDPPNRAIITELAANGSLWDALRLPLTPPYTVADGINRDTWPIILYDPGKHGTPPSSAVTPLPPVPSRGSWPWVLVKRVACGAARGMAYLHNGNPPILHRDLKSANILLNEAYEAKVCDFGLSRLKAQERSMTGNCGTVQWMAPEVLANQAYNEKADVFSYGIICIELLTRECPYEGMSAIQCALAVLNRDYRPEIPRWCPPALHALIKACVKKNPDERPTFAQVILALDAMP